MFKVTRDGILSRVRPSRLLFAVFVVTPLVEIALFVAIGDRIGIGSTVLVVIITALVGTVLVSRQGRGAMETVRFELAGGSFPGKELAHGAMILVAGALLLTPGFFTDGIGFALLVPRVRELLRQWAVHRYGQGPINIT